MTMHSTRNATAGILIGIGCWLPVLVSGDGDGQGLILIISLALFAVAGVLVWGRLPQAKLRTAPRTPAPSPMAVASRTPAAQPTAAARRTPAAPRTPGAPA